MVNTTCNCKIGRCFQCGECSQCGCDHDGAPVSVKIQRKRGRNKGSLNETSKRQKN